MVGLADPEGELGQLMSDSPEPPDNSPHSRFQHLYVVVRLDNSTEVTSDRRAPSDEDVVLTKAFASEADANAEARRLNESNQRSSHYFVRVARVVDEQ